jgi:NADPH:quinone reductase-like Zn-dependent oxidoreductase
MEVAGVVTAVGPDAQGMTGPLAVGDEVIAFPVSGGYAEKVIAASANVIAKPADLPFEQAAGLLAAGTTAAHLMAATDVAAGDTVLIHGAGGGVGLFVTQLAVLKGARVIATASPRRHDSLRDYGAVPVEYGPGLSERVKAAAGGEVNIAMDLVGTDEAVEVSLELISDPTRIATIAAFTKVEGTGIKLLGGGGPSAELGTEVRDSSRPELANLAGQGRLQVAVDRTFPLDQAADAHRHLQQGHTAGKVVLVP